MSESDWEGIGERGQNQRHRRKKIAIPELEFQLCSFGKLLGLSELQFHFLA